MARIGEVELERLKAETSLVRLVEASGIRLEKRGKDMVASCPFHAEDTASFVVTPEKNLFHCFGCGAAGGPVDWVMKRNGVSFRHAVELLRDGMPSVTNDTVKRTTVRALAPPVTLDGDDRALLDQVVGYYHETLKKSPEALAYLQRRGIGRSDAIERFKLGFADRTLGLRLPDKQRKEGAAIRARLAKIGLYRDSGHEHFNGSLIIPILNDKGEASEVYGRKITEGLRAGTPLHLYLPGPHQGVWNPEGLKDSGGEVILCEALIDALTFWCAGFSNVTAAYGVEGFTPDHLAAFKANGIKRVLIAFDRDEAGERGTAKLAAKLTGEGIDCFRILFPKGLDANAYALKLKPASKSLGLLIRKAEWLGQGAAPAGPTSLPVTQSDDPIPALVASTAAAKKEDAVERETVLEAAEPVLSEHGHGIPLSSLVAASLAAPVPEDDPLPARVQPSPPAAEPEPDVSERGIALSFGERRYRVRGLERNLAVDVMKVNLLASCGDVFHVDTFDLYSAKARTNFIQMAAGELRVKPETVKLDVGRLLLKLEGLQDVKLAETLKPEPERVIDTAAHDAALAFLRSPHLLKRIVADFEACGLVGEATNKLVAYLAAISRKLAHPLAVLVQSSSAAGKSSLMDAVLAFVPEEERVRYSALTGQALFYMGETSLKHRILAISEEEGAAKASYALKLLQSEGEITIASTAKDADTGNLVTQEYRVEGPVMIFLTTTAIAIDEELMNRCLVLGVDEGRAQTQAIHKLQRRKRTLEGLMGQTAKHEIIALHRNAQRLLRPLAIVNPYADHLSFLSDKTRARRDHEKYLTLIDAIALLHQHQRTVKRLAVTPRTDGDDAAEAERVLDYIEVSLADIEAANLLAHEVLGRVIDELPPQTRNLLNRIAGFVGERCTAQGVPRSEVRFTRRELREITHMSDTQVKVHLARLVELEYVLMHRTGQGQGHVYELVYDGDGSANPHLSGLIDVEKLRSSICDAEQPGVKTQQPDPGRGVVGGRTAAGRRAKTDEHSDRSTTSVETSDIITNLHILPDRKPSSSHINGPSQTQIHSHTRPPASSSLAASSSAAVTR